MNFSSKKNFPLKTLGSPSFEGDSSIYIKYFFSGEPPYNDLIINVI